MQLQNIYFPVRKLPVPPDEVDLIRITLIDSVFQPDENGTIKEYRKVYYETSFKGKKVSDGNNLIPAELVPLIYNAKDNVLTMDYAMQNFGFAILHEVFEKNPNVFVNPYQNESVLSPNINQLPLPIPNTNNETNITEQNGTNSGQSTDSQQPTDTSQSAIEPTTAAPTPAD